MISSQALDVTSFCALGALTETQQVALAALQAVDQADPEKVFAETLSLLSIATSRAATSAAAKDAELRDHIAQVLQALPLTLHSYVAGGDVLRDGGESREDLEASAAAIERMLDFYNAQLPQGVLPDRRALRHVTILWMGRISPPGLNEHPEARVDRLELVERLSVHVRLVEAYARNALSG